MRSSSASCLWSTTLQPAMAQGWWEGLIGLSSFSGRLASRRDAITIDFIMPTSATSADPAQPAAVQPSMEVKRIELLALLNSSLKASVSQIFANVVEISVKIAIFR